METIDGFNGKVYYGLRDGEGTSTMVIGYNWRNWREGKKYVRETFGTRVDLFF